MRVINSVIREIIRIFSTSPEIIKTMYFKALHSFYANKLQKIK